MVYSTTYNNRYTLDTFDVIIIFLKIVIVSVVVLGTMMLQSGTYARVFTDGSSAYKRYTHSRSSKVADDAVREYLVSKSVNSRHVLKPTGFTCMGVNSCMVMPLRCVTSRH